MGQICGLAPGCGTPQWMCVPNTCADAIALWFCGCDGETFVGGGCLTPDRPYTARGQCSSGIDGGGDGSNDGGSDDGGGESLDGASQDDGGSHCATPCGADEICGRAPGCGTPQQWMCVRNTCGDAISIGFCGCDGVTFYGGGCLTPDRPYSAPGLCSSGLDGGGDGG